MAQWLVHCTHSKIINVILLLSLFHMKATSVWLRMAGTGTSELQVDVSPEIKASWPVTAAQKRNRMVVSALSLRVLKQRWVSKEANVQDEGGLGPQDLWGSTQMSGSRFSHSLSKPWVELCCLCTTASTHLCSVLQNASWHLQRTCPVSRARTLEPASSEFESWLCH